MRTSRDHMINFPWRPLKFQNKQKYTKKCGFIFSEEPEISPEASRGKIKVKSVDIMVVKNIFHYGHILLIRYHFGVENRCDTCVTPPPLWVSRNLVISPYENDIHLKLTWILQISKTSSSCRIHVFFQDCIIHVATWILQISQHEFYNTGRCFKSSALYF